MLTLSEGEVTHLHVGLKGTMNALFLKRIWPTRPAADSVATSRRANRVAAMPMATRYDLYTEQFLAEADKPPPLPHPSMALQYRKRVQPLYDAL